MRMQKRQHVDLTAVLLLCAWLLPARSHAGGLQGVKPDLSITSAFAGPASESRFCMGSANRVYVTVRREGGSAFAGPIRIWLVGRGLTGRLPTGGIQNIEYVKGASSWLVIFHNVRIDSEWRSADPLFTVIVNPETDGRHPIAESNYNNNSYTLKLSEHTDWGRKCQ